MLTMNDPATSGCYLSRLRLNPRSREVRRDLANSQALHRRLLDAFPHVASRAEVDLLYRVEASRGGFAPDLTVLVQSTNPPDWEHLPGGYLGEVSHAFGWSLEGSVDVKEVGTRFSTIANGQAFRFRLRANPTKKCHFQAGDVDEHGKPRRPTGPNGTRIPLFDDHELNAWLLRKAELHGFRVTGARWQPDPVTGDRQRGSKASGHQLTHHAILFDGLLSVEQDGEFQRALSGGIGPAKAYGFGLLSLAPVQASPV